MFLDRSAEQSWSSPQALPIPNGRLAVWLFLSTEVMFFSALLGTYLIFRISAGPGNWPSHAQTRVHPEWGWINTIVLLSSSITIAWASAAAVRQEWGRARTWLAVTLLLGCGFLGIKFQEYREKFRLGLLPGASPSGLHDRADVYYLAHLKAVIDSASLGTAPSTERTPSKTASAEWLPATQLGLVHFIEQELAQQPPGADPDPPLELLARIVYSPEDREELQADLERERQQLEQRHSQIQQEVLASEANLRLEQTQLSQLEEQAAAASDSTAQAAIRDRLRIEKERAQVAAQQLTRLKTQETRFLQRREFLDLYLQSPPAQALDEKLGIVLPKVIPQGRNWSSNYLLLTGCHALHLVAGLMVMIGLLGARTGPRFGSWLENTALYWHFVDGVWLAVFVAIYLLG